jgi:hypothetical protein
MFLNPILANRDVQYCLQNGRSGVVLATRLETAFDSKSRRLGLLGRGSMEDGAALIIAPCNAVHTFFMRFPIDVIFVARDGRVVKAKDSLAMWRMAFAPRAFAVIECPTGVIRSSQTRIGDRLTVVPTPSGR